MTIAQPPLADGGLGQQQKRLWSPVRAQTADSFWLLLIMSLSVTVIVTRTALELTGYPQVGDSTYHIAHLLWGGLAMFVALVLPLTIANPYTPWLAAVLGGVGAGLFIDEVGKFITQSNDYFYPLAFPIIYAFVVGCIWLLLRIRAHRPRDARTLLYHALEDLKQVVDNDLDPFERRELREELRYVVGQTEDVEDRALAEALLTFIRNRQLRLAQNPTAIEQLWTTIRLTFSRTPSRVIARTFLIVAFAYLAVTSLLELVAFGALATRGGREAIAQALGDVVIVSGKSQYVVNTPILAATQLLCVAACALFSLAAAILLALGRERIGLRLGTLSLVISLVIVNLISFYFNQLYAVVSTLGEATVLGVAMIYRWRFLRSAQPESAGGASA